MRAVIRPCHNMMQHAMATAAGAGGAAAAALGPDLAPRRHCSILSGHNRLEKQVHAACCMRGGRKGSPALRWPRETSAGTCRLRLMWGGFWCSKPAD